MSKIRVLIIEDSLLIQKTLEDIIKSDPALEVVGKASTAASASEKIKTLKPDVVTLDIHLPDASGLVVLKEAMKKNPTRAIMLSAYTQTGAEITMKALQLGALDFIPKPSGEISLDLNKFRDEIISKIKIVADVDIAKYMETFRGVPVVEEALAIEKIVVIAASTGGPRAIVDIMQKIPVKYNTSFLIVQHMPQGFTKPFAERVSWHSQYKVKEAAEGDLVARGAAYVAPAGFHMLLERIEEDKDLFRIRLDETALVNYLRPSADVTMCSVADSFGDRAVGVVLTGMGKDGLEGAKKLKEKGATIIAQDEVTSVVYGMPRVVAEAGIADSIVSLDKIPDEIVKHLV